MARDVSIRVFYYIDLRGEPGEGITRAQRVEKVLALREFTGYRRKVVSWRKNGYRGGKWRARIFGLIKSREVKLAWELKA